MTLKSDILTKQSGLLKKRSVSLRFIMIPDSLHAVFCGSQCHPYRELHRNAISGIAPSVTFTDLSTGTGLTNWSWNFGDGNITNLTASANRVHLPDGGTQKREPDRY